MPRVPQLVRPDLTLDFPDSKSRALSSAPPINMIHPEKHGKTNDPIQSDKENQKNNMNDNADNINTKAQKQNNKKLNAVEIG